MKKVVAILFSLSAVAVHAQTYSVQQRPNVVYDTVDGIPLTMDLYIPSDTEGTKRPVAVTIHGGCFTGGAKEDMHWTAHGIASEGFVVANINYRKAPQHLYPAAQQDARAAVRYLRQNAEALGIDPNRIAAYGHSAGSSLAATLATQPIFGRNFEQDSNSLPINLAVNMYGRMDFTHDAYPYTPAHLDCAEQYLGKSREQAPDAFRQASIVHNIGTTAARFINFHSVRDNVVLPLHAQRMHQRLLESGLKSTLIIQEDGDHWAPENIQRFARKLMKREFGMAAGLYEATASAIRVDSGNLKPSTVPAGYTIDQFYSGGNAITFNPKRYPISQTLSKTVRWTDSSFAYNFSNVDTSIKKVRFSFIEPEEVGEGYRLQDILLGNFKMFEHHDIVKLAGHGRVTIWQDIYIATSSPTMNLRFDRKATGNVGVASVEVTPISIND